MRYKRRAPFLYPHKTGQGGQLPFKISAPPNEADMLPKKASRAQANNETLKGVSGVETGQTASQSGLRHSGARSFDWPCSLQA